MRQTGMAFCENAREPLHSHEVQAEWLEKAII